MISRLLLLLALFAAALTPVVAAPRATPVIGFTSFTSDFAAFADGTAHLPDTQRLTLFKARVAPLFPDFYAPRERDLAKFDAQILRALKGFPEIRDRYNASASSFATAYAGATGAFRRVFPDYRPMMPVYLVHSLGEMDGGTRELAGRAVAVFGADVIARIHDRSTIAPFLHHELFHIYHAQFFPDCDPLWCSLWQEGLATYVAARMSPGATDRQLMLTIPRPIRPEVEPRLAEAMCLVRGKFDSTDKQDYTELFFGNGSGKVFAPRYGYFLGYVLADRIGKSIPLARLAKLPPTQVRRLLEREIDAIGHCGANKPG